MAFDPDAYLAKNSAPAPQAGGFNPDAYLAKKSGREPSQFPVSTLGPDGGSIPEGPSKKPTRRVPIESAQGRIIGYREIEDEDSGEGGQAALESFGNTVSFGYLPQIQAGVESLYSDEPYVELRDQNIARQNKQFEDYPAQAIGGMLAGTGVTAPIGAGIAKSVGMVSKLGKTGSAIASGAGYGVLSNPGDTEGEVSPLQASERAKGAAAGGALGVGAQVVGTGIAKASEAIRNTPKISDKISNIAAVKSIGAIGRDFKKLFGSNNADSIGETLLKNKIVEVGDTIEDIANKSKAAKELAGKKIGEINSQVNDFIKYNSTLSGSGFTSHQKKLLDITKLDGGKLSSIAGKKIEASLKNNLSKEKVLGQINPYLESLKGLGDDVPLKDVLEARASVDDAINYSKELRDLPETQQQLKTIRDVLNKAVENRVSAVGKVVKDPTLIKELKDAKRTYGQLSKATSIATNRAKELEGNNYFTFSENIVGGFAGAGAAGSSIAQGDDPLTVLQKSVTGYFAGAAARKVGKYAPQVIAKSAKRFGKLMQTPANMAKYGSPLIEAAKQSPEEFQAVWSKLQNDPGFKKLLNPQGATP